MIRCRGIRGRWRSELLWILIRFNQSVELPHQAVTSEEERIELVVAACDGRRIGLYFLTDGTQGIQEVLLFPCDTGNHGSAFYSL